MKRFMLILLAVMLLICALPLGSAAAQEPTPTPAPSPTQGEIDAEEQRKKEEFDRTLTLTLQALDLGDLQRLVAGSPLLNDALKGQDADDLVSSAGQGVLSLDVMNIANALLNRFLAVLRDNLGLIFQLLLIALVMSIMGAVGPTVMSGEVAKVCQLAGYLMIVLLATKTLGNVYQMSLSAITNLTSVMEAIFPVLLTLLTALGSTAAVGVFQPAMTVLTGSIITMVKRFALPGILAGGVLSLAQNLTGREQIKRLTEVVVKVAQWVTTVVFVIFLGVTALQGLTSATFDGVSIRTAKFAIGKFVPIVGGMVSDTVDTLIGCSLVVKQGVGVVGLLVLVGTILEPVLHIAAISFTFRLTAALIEPFGDHRLSDCLQSLSKIFTLFMVAVLAAGIMMFILTTLLIRAGNVNMMLR